MSVFDRFRLDGKKMLITGGSRGLEGDGAGNCGSGRRYHRDRSARG